MIIKILLIVLALVALSRVVYRFRKKEITPREFLFWAIVWVGVTLVSAYPDVSSRAAEWLGVGRGADVVVYLSLLLVFYLLFRLFVRMEKIEQDITKIVRAIALKDTHEKKH